MYFTSATETLQLDATSAFHYPISKETILLQPAQDLSTSEGAIKLDPTRRTPAMETLQLDTTKAFGYESHHPILLFSFLELPSHVVGKAIPNVRMQPSAREACV